ncbi:MAG: hypothetical protein DRP71_10300 [Verrucomicrobia bacterium]|nr:MAG: hypothetical protein DRP71_10300 [Verrucomicrobiota bacterium]
MSEKQDKRAHLLGVGLDNADGHKRVTVAEEFSIVGGSSETHDRMTETVMKTFEELRSRGKSLAQVNRDELGEILDQSSPK